MSLPVSGFIWRAIVCTLMLMSALPSRAASVTPALQQSTRAATFEVVMPKKENPQISYEKKLPLELLPFTERNDQYWSIGTAFAIDANTFVSAGHVLLQGIGSQLGEPALRDAAGKVYQIDKVRRFSLDQDFIVFSLREPPPVTPLQTNRTPQLDDEVFAVGNALGDGIVIRSGLYTSATAEDQDGRWKWIRFSAAASPGNSGGPLLDTQGRVIGIVIAKSESENLNYALPITQVLDAPDNQARFDKRTQYAFPVLNEPLTRTLKGEFTLPKSFTEFAATLSKATHLQYDAALAELLSNHSQELFPLGAGANKLLAEQGTEYFPQLIAQNKNDEWTAQASTDITRTALPGEGFLSIGYSNSLALLRLHRPDEASDSSFYSDSKQFMNLFLKGDRFSRQVGSELVRVTSLGAATHDELITDSLGRQWQLRSWPITFLDSHLITLLLPTPDGYSGVMQLVPGSNYDNTISSLKQLSQYLQVSYWGSLPQWQAFMQNKTLLPTTLGNSNFSFSNARGLQFKSKRLDLNIPAAAFKFSDAANLGMSMHYMLDTQSPKQALTLEVGGLSLFTDDAEKTSLAVMRKIKPDDAAGKELNRTWDSMRKLESPYNSYPSYNSQNRKFWIATALSSSATDNNARALATRNDQSQVRYVVDYSTEDEVTPSEVSDTLRQILQGTRILER